MAEYSWDTEVEKNKKVYVLVIYDIVSDKRRARMVKCLNGYGFRVQKSAFEACLTEKQYDNFIARLEKKVNKDDNVRIYKLYSVNEVKAYGEEREDFEEVVVV